jgi:hypothetical protein
MPHLQGPSALVSSAEDTHGIAILDTGAERRSF